jgi:hypothetical protein
MVINDCKNEFTKLSKKIGWSNEAISITSQQLKSTALKTGINEE